jgi:hypothetical protein
MEQIMKDILESLRNPTPEQKERDRQYCNQHFNTSGRMTQSLFDEVIHGVKQLRCLDSEDISYGVSKVAFTGSDFDEVYSYLKASVSDEDILQDPESMFPCGIFYFNVDKDVFEWSMTHGQGTLCRLMYMSTRPDNANILDRTLVNVELPYCLPVSLVDKEGNRI